MAQLTQSLYIISRIIAKLNSDNCIIDELLTGRGLYINFVSRDHKLKFVKLEFNPNQYKIIFGDIQSAIEDHSITFADAEYEKVIESVCDAVIK